MKPSVVVPTKGLGYIELLIRALRSQTMKPYEIVVVAKDCDTKYIEELLRENVLRGFVIEQQEGFFTHALNIGKQATSGDIIIFTDNDVIPLPKWVERYIRLHKRYSKVAGISSIDIYVDLERLKLVPTPDHKSYVRIYRWFIRTWLDEPHPLLKKYRLGVYLSRKLTTVYGPFIPYRICWSLPLRGANMSFKKEYVYDIRFPEHPRLVRGANNERYFGLQLILRGYDMIYTPSNPVLHILHESLSRTKDEKALKQMKQEEEIVRALMIQIIKSHG